MNLLYKKYHSFEEWRQMSQSEKSQWYQAQTTKSKEGFNRQPENEAQEIECTERLNSLRHDDLQKIMETLF